MSYQQKITFGEMRETGVRHVLIYCRDHKCSHHIEVSADRCGTVVKKRPQSQDGPRSMTNQTPLRVFFSCLSCEAVYYATQKRKPTIIGRFACKRCKTTVHRWWGHPIQFYGLDGTARRNRAMGRNLVMHARVAVMKR